MEIEGLQIFCPLCGNGFVPAQTKTNICLQCVTSTGDIASGITKEAVLNQCRNCKRYQKPPYVYCERESRELLALCLKKIKGLNQVKIIDASFIYTEPHSRRVKVKVTVQKEIAKDINLQETFVVEFTEHNQQCEDCQKEFTPHTWGAVVQLRQPIQHKKTLFYLEQVILKHNAHDKCVKVTEEEFGIDFFFKNRQHANRLADFLETLVVCQTKNSKQLLSNDIQNGTASYKFTYAMIIPKLCKDDIVIVTEKQRKMIGASTCVLLCQKVLQKVKLMDPNTMNIFEINDKIYFEYEQDLKIIPFHLHKTEFQIIDCEIDNYGRNNNTSFQTNSHKSVRLHIVRTSDWKEFNIKCHLGDIFKPGDTFLGWDIEQLNVEELNDQKGCAQVILIRKVRSKESKRIYKLKRMEMEGRDMDKRRKNNKQQQKGDADQHFEEFMEELDNDKEKRKNVNLYKDHEVIEEKKRNQLLRKKNKEKKVQRDEDKRKKLIIKKQFNDSKINQSKQNIQKKENDSESEWEDEDGININDLINDFKLEDDEDFDNNQPLQQNDRMVDDFIKQLDKIKITK